MMRIPLFFVAASLLSGCFGTDGYEGGMDALYGPGADLKPLCTSNNDGVIERSEEAFPIGVSVNYLFNPPGTTVTVAPDGVQLPSGSEWDLRSTAGEIHQFTLEAVQDKWFASSFPDADYTAVTDIASHTMGIFKVSDKAVSILGYASEQPDQTLLVYDTPIVSLRFPIRDGDGFVSSANVLNGKINGQTIATHDTYRVTVDRKGTVDLPFFQLENTLRVHVELSQTVPGGISVTHTKYIFMHECYGELGHMLSNPGETDPSFTAAAEFSRVAL